MAKGIVIVGLGPGDPSHLTREASQVLQESEELYLRTTRHPTVAHLPRHLTVHSFDALYESGESFEQVYRSIARRVVELGQRPDGIVYAVPGHPLVGEATVRLILAMAAQTDLPVRVVAGLSFLEPVLTHLGLDPLARGLQVVDATELATRYHPSLDPDLPALVAQLYSRSLAADVKLTLLNAYPPVHSVTLVQGAGTADVAWWTVPLVELDRQANLDDLTTLFIPALPRPGSVASLQDVVAHLRAPEGCPWDREQTHQSLRPYLLEETYEVLAALDADDPGRLSEELGDLLLQVLIHTQISVEGGDFTLADVVTGIREKLIRRHPHVFGDLVVETAEQVKRNWEQLKRLERHEAGRADDPFAGVPLALPALARSQEIQSRAARLGFDWPQAEGVWQKVSEELDELRQASCHDGTRNDKRSRSSDPSEGFELQSPRDRLSNELGDLLFVLVNLARWLGVDAESALRQANARFVERFTAMERLAEERGLMLAGMSLEEMDALWEEVKESTRNE